jgi:hypothetical protein
MKYFGVLAGYNFIYPAKTVLLMECIMPSGYINLGYQLCHHARSADRWKEILIVVWCSSSPKCISRFKAVKIFYTLQIFSLK